MAAVDVGAYELKLQTGLDSYPLVKIRPLDGDLYDAVIEYLKAAHDDRALVIAGTHQFRISYQDPDDEGIIQVGTSIELHEAVNMRATLAVTLEPTGLPSSVPVNASLPLSSPYSSGSYPPSAPAIPGQAPPQPMMQQWMAATPTPQQQFAPAVAAEVASPAVAAIDPYATNSAIDSSSAHDDDDDDGEDVLDNQLGRGDKKEGQSSPDHSFSSNVVEGLPDQPLHHQQHHHNNNIPAGYGAAAPHAYAPGAFTPMGVSPYPSSQQPAAAAAAAGMAAVFGNGGRSDSQPGMSWRSEAIVNDTTNAIDPSHMSHQQIQHPPHHYHHDASASAAASGGVSPNRPVIPTPVVMLSQAVQPAPAPSAAVAVSSFGYGGYAAPQYQSPAASMYEAASNSATMQRPSSASAEPSPQPPYQPPQPSSLSRPASDGIISVPLSPDYPNIFPPLDEVTASMLAETAASPNGAAQIAAARAATAAAGGFPAAAATVANHHHVNNGLGSPLSKSAHRRIDQSAGPASEAQPAPGYSLRDDSALPVAFSAPGNVTPHPSSVPHAAVAAPQQPQPQAPAGAAAVAAAVLSPVASGSPMAVAAVNGGSGNGASFSRDLNIRAADGGSFSIKQQQPLIMSSIGSNGNGNGGASVRAPCVRLAQGKECKLQNNASHMAKFNHQVCPYWQEEGVCTEGVDDPDHNTEFVHPNPDLAGGIGASSILVTPQTPALAPPAAVVAAPQVSIASPTRAALPSATPVAFSPINNNNNQATPSPQPVAVASPAVVVPVVSDSPPFAVTPVSIQPVVVTPPSSVTPPLPTIRPPSLPATRPPPLPASSSSSSSAGGQAVPPAAEACPFGHACRLQNKPAHVARWHQPGAAAKLSFNSSRLSDSIRLIMNGNPVPLVCPFGDLCPLLRAGNIDHCRALRHPCVIDSSAGAPPCRQIELPQHFTMWTHKNDHETVYRRSGEDNPPARTPCGWPCPIIHIASHAYENSHPCVDSFRGLCTDMSVAHRTYYRHTCPEGSKCTLLLQEDQAHMRKVMHPCPHGSKCINQNQAIHWKLWYHSDYNFPDAASKLGNTGAPSTPAPAPVGSPNKQVKSPLTPFTGGTLRPICQNMYPCPQIKQHAADFRHPCVMLMATGTCSQRHDPAHRLLWRELCPEGISCQQAADGIEEHKSEWLHLCEHGATCGGQTDSKHMMYYYHAKPQQQQVGLNQNPVAASPAAVPPQQAQQGGYPQPQYSGYPAPASIAPSAPAPSTRRIVPLTGKARCPHPEPWSCPAKNNADHQAIFSHPCMTAIMLGSCADITNPEHAAAFVHPCSVHAGVFCPELKTNPDHKMDALHECPMFGKGCKETGLTHAGATGPVWYHKPSSAPLVASPQSHQQFQPGQQPTAVPMNQQPFPQQMASPPPVWQQQPGFASPTGATPPPVASPPPQAFNPGMPLPVSPPPGTYPALHEPCYNDQPPAGCAQLHDEAHRRFHRHTCRDSFGNKCLRVNPNHPEFHQHIAEWSHPCPLEAMNKCLPAMRSPLHNYQWYHRPAGAPSPATQQ